MYFVGVEIVTDTFTAEINAKVPADLRTLLDRRDGAALLLAQLPRVIRPVDVASPTDLQRAWELCGLYFSNQNRMHEALSLFHGLYDHMLAYQDETQKYAHKGMPLVWISDCYSRLGCPVLAKRYLMMTACEDAIRDRGEIPSETTGIYFRMTWSHGLSHQYVNKYAVETYRLFQSYPQEALFPEWILQEIDQDWMTEYPSLQESARYVVTERYVRWLLQQLGAGGGKALERLAHYLLSAIPGCRAYRRTLSQSTDYDVICSLEGLEIDFRSDLGRYFLCECKDWESPADFSAFAKFCRVLDSAKCRFGILFSKNGISGAGRTAYAAREQLKVFQDRGMVVVVVCQDDLEQVTSGASLIAMLRRKYEAVRLDLSN